MRTAGLVLGMVAAIMAFLLGALLLIFGIMILREFPLIETFISAPPLEIDGGIISSGKSEEDYSKIITGKRLTSKGSALLFASVFGITGALGVNRRNITSGILMIISAVISLFTLIGFILSILFLLGGIFSLKKERWETQPQTIR